MYVYLSKILPPLVMPLSVAIAFIVIGLLFLRRDMRTVAAGFIALSVLILWIGSMPVIATGLYRHLESQYPPVVMERIPAGDCIVLLGGAVSAPMPPRVDVEFNEAVDRVYKTAKLFGAGKGRIVIVTAGNQPWSESRWAEAELIRDLLMEWGVPEKSIMLEGSSRNTRENAQYSKNIIDAVGCGQPLLVTSAAHMPRAMSAFLAVGIRATPVSTDVRAADTHGTLVTDYLPSAQAMAMTSDALREWIGQWVYSLQGWN